MRQTRIKKRKRIDFDAKLMMLKDESLYGQTGNIYQDCEQSNNYDGKGSKFLSQDLL